MKSKTNLNEFMLKDLKVEIEIKGVRRVKTCYASIINDLSPNESIIMEQIVLLGKNDDGIYQYEPIAFINKKLREKNIRADIIQSICKQIDQEMLMCSQIRDGDLRYCVEERSEKYLCELVIKFQEKDAYDNINADKQNIQNDQLFVGVNAFEKIEDDRIISCYSQYPSLKALLNKHNVEMKKLNSEISYRFPKWVKKYSDELSTTSISTVAFSVSEETVGVYYATVTYKTDESPQRIKIRYHKENDISLHNPDDDKTIKGASLRKHLIEQLENEFSQNNLPRVFYEKKLSNQDTKEQTELGRTKNAEGEKNQDCKLSSCNRCAKAPFLYYRDNQSLRESYLLDKDQNEEWYINKWCERTPFRLKYLGDIRPSRLELLSWLNDLKYIHMEALLDMVESGIIDWGRDVKFESALDSLYKYGLIDELKFVSIQKNCNNKLDGTRIWLDAKPSNTTIYTLGESGAKLLRDVGREGQYNPFDRFQDGNVVKAKLAANQWLIYWLYAYRDKFSRQYYTSRKIYVRDVEQSGVRIHAAVKCDNTFIVGEPVRRTAKDLKKQFQDELLDKFDRFMIVFDDAKQDDIFSSYDKVFLPEKKIICYICEDLNHVDEVYYMLQSKREKYPNQEIWFTTDLKTHNYNEEGQRFIVFNEKGEPAFVDLNKRFGLGKEREDWEKIEEFADQEASIPKN